MSDLTIRSNYVARNVLSWHDLSTKEQADFDYLVPDESDGEQPENDRRYETTFARYKGHVYDLGEFMRTPADMFPDNRRKWQGYTSDSYFSGVLLAYPENDCETVILATYFS